MGRFSYPIYRYAMYQYTFIEDLIKTGLAIMRLMKMEFIGSKESLNRFGGMLINLRNFTEDGKGIDLLNLLPGKDWWGPCQDLGKTIT